MLLLLVLGCLYVVSSKDNELHNAEEAGADPELHRASNGRYNHIPRVVRNEWRLR